MQPMTPSALHRLAQDLGPYKLVQKDGTVYGVPYHGVQPVGWMHMGDNAGWSQMIEWCVNTYGPAPDDGVWTPNARWYPNNACLWFRDESDKMLFVLRWS